MKFLRQSIENPYGWYFKRIPGYHLKLRENPIHRIYIAWKYRKPLREYIRLVKCFFRGHKIFIIPETDPGTPGPWCMVCGKHFKNA